MDNFKSGENVFMLYSIIPRQSAKGEKSLIIVLDVPYTEALVEELGHFLWKDVKLMMEKTSGGNAIETEFYITDIQPKDFKEGPRIRVKMRNPYDQAIHLKLVKLLFHDVSVDVTIMEMQPELEYDDQDEEDA